MKEFIEITCLDGKGSPYKRLVNMRYVFDVMPVSEGGCNSRICFAPFDTYQETYKYVISVVETYEQIKGLVCP